MERQVVTWSASTSRRRARMPTRRSKLTVVSSSTATTVVATAAAPARLPPSGNSSRHTLTASARSRTQVAYLRASRASARSSNRFDHHGVGPRSRNADSTPREPWCTVSRRRRRFTLRWGCRIQTSSRQQRSFSKRSYIQFEAENRRKTDEEINVYQGIEHDGRRTAVVAHQDRHIESHQQTERHQRIERVRPLEEEKNEQT